MIRVHAWKGLALVALLAASCGQKEPIVSTVTQVRDRPVMVACLRPDQVPVQPPRLVADGPMPPTLTEQVARFRAKIKQWEDWYGPTVAELLRSCSQVPAPTASAQTPP